MKKSCRNGKNTRYILRIKAKWANEIKSNGKSLNKKISSCRLQSNKVYEMPFGASLNINYGKQQIETKAKEKENGRPTVRTLNRENKFLN